MNMQLLVFTIRSQNPFREIGNGEAPPPVRVVAQPQTAYLDRIPGAIGSKGDEHNQLLANSMTIVLEHGRTLAMAGAIRILLPNRQGRWCPQRAALFIAQIDCLRWCIAHRIVVPARQTVGLAVAAPCEPSPTLAYQRAEFWAGHHVHPRQWRLAAGFQVNGIFAAIGGESAQAIKVRQLEKR